MIGISNEQLMNELEQYRPYIIRHAKRLARRVAGQAGDMADDIIGAIYLGWTQARDEFDPARGLKFTTLAMWKARREILNLLRQIHPLGMTYWEKQTAGILRPMLSLNFKTDDGQELGETVSGCRRAAERSPSRDQISERPDSNWSPALWQRAAAELPQDLRQLFLAHYRDGVPFKQLAQERGEARHQIYLKLTRGLAKLKDVGWLRDELAA